MLSRGLCQRRRCPRMVHDPLRTVAQTRRSHRAPDCPAAQNLHDPRMRTAAQGSRVVCEALLPAQAWEALQHRRLRPTTAGSRPVPNPPKASDRSGNHHPQKDCIPHVMHRGRLRVAAHQQWALRQTPGPHEYPRHHRRPAPTNNVRTAHVKGGQGRPHPGTCPRTWTLLDLDGWPQRVRLRVVLGWC